jgi:hypothetical protein
LALPLRLASKTPFLMLSFKFKSTLTVPPRWSSISPVIYPPPEYTPD